MHTIGFPQQRNCATPRDLACEGTVLRIGNRVGVVDMKVFAVDDPEKSVASGKGVYNIRRPRDATSGASRPSD